MIITTLAFNEENLIQIYLQTEQYNSNAFNEKNLKKLNYTLRYIKLENEQVKMNLEQS